MWRIPWGPCTGPVALSLMGLGVPLVIQAQGATPPLIAPLQPWAILAALGPTAYLVAKAVEVVLKLKRDGNGGSRQDVHVSTGNGGTRELLARREGEEAATLKGSLDTILGVAQAVRGSNSLLADALRDQSDRLERLESSYRVSGQALDRLALVSESNAKVLDTVAEYLRDVPAAVKRSQEVHALMTKRRKGKRKP